METPKPRFSRTVYLLSYISMFADIASELLYPILPIYLQSIGFNSAMIGVLEGCADLVSGLSKSIFGRWSDVIGKRMPFVWVGYLASILSKGLIGIITAPWWIFLCRTVDRLGKGVRTSARDAVLIAEANHQNKGAVFGFHRAMDTTGAFLGPILALVFLYYNPGEYQKLFLIALAPIVVIVPLLKMIPEKPLPAKPEPVFQNSFAYWKRGSFKYKQSVVIISLFTLINSSDVFLLLKAKEVLKNDLWVVGCYIFYNFVYASSAYGFGKLSDKIGKAQTFGISLLFFAAAYFLMAVSKDVNDIAIAFFIYGLYSGASDGTIKAWISSYAGHNDMAEALGFQSSVQSICALIASSVAGLIWIQFGSIYVFIMAAVSALVIAMVLQKFVIGKSTPPVQPTI